MAPKTERNNAILKKRKEGWSFRRIADFFNLDVKTVYNVYSRDTKKKGVGSFPHVSA